jgi:hypothetical protein
MPCKRSTEYGWPAAQFRAHSRARRAPIKEKSHGFAAPTALTEINPCIGLVRPPGGGEVDADR